MSKRRNAAIVAAALYLMFGVFAAAVLVGWSGDSPAEAIRSLPTIPGAVEVFSVAAVLIVASFVLAGVLLFRARVSVVVLVASIVMAVVGVAWNIVAALFWLAPVPFVWIAYHAPNDD